MSRDYVEKGTRNRASTGSVNVTVLPESDNTILVEGNHYFARESVREEALRDSEHHSVCMWKGLGPLLHHRGRKTNADAAWYYPEPKEAAKDIAGYSHSGRGVQAR